MKLPEYDDCPRCSWHPWDQRDNLRPITPGKCAFCGCDLPIVMTASEVERRVKKLYQKIKAEVSDADEQAENDFDNAIYKAYLESQKRKGSERRELIKMAMQGILCAGEGWSAEDLADRAVMFADATLKAMEE